MTGDLKRYKAGLYPWPTASNQHDIGDEVTHYKPDAEVSDEYVWSVTSYLDQERKNEPGDPLLWVAAVAALLL